MLSDVGIIVSLCFAGVTLLMSICSKISARRKAKFSKRIQPIVSIYEDSHDNIETKANDDSAWFVDVNTIDDMVKNNYYYILIKNNDKYQMRNSRLTMIVPDENKKQTIQYNIGTISLKRNAVIPLKNDNISSIKIIFGYESEYGEQLQYATEISKIKGIMGFKDGRLRLQKRKHKIKEIRKARKEDRISHKKHKDNNISPINDETGKIVDIIHYDLSFSLSTQDFKTKLNGRKLSKINEKEQ